MAAERGAAFDIRAAADAYFTAAGLGCTDAEVGGHYLRGLAVARDAYAQGGSPESLAPVTQALATLDARAGRLPGAAQVARYVLQAAAAAAQSERDVMALLIDHALRLETVQLAAGQPPLPVVSAHEAAGDFWLQVHRFEEARSAYQLAAQRTGSTNRVLLGLARAAGRLKDDVAACTHYRELVARWAGRSQPSPEIAEARAFVSQPPCAGAARPRAVQP